MNVYMIQNKVNGAVYVGKTNVPASRKWEHFWKSCNPHLRSAMRLYGQCAFEFSVLETFDTEQEAYEQEIWWIAYLRSLGAVLYNIDRGGRGASRGRPISDATREKLKIGSTGRVYSVETRAKIGAAHKGKTLSAETIAKQKRSLAASGYMASIEARAKMSAAHRGKPRSPEVCAKISAAQKGRVFTEEHRANLSTATERRRLTAAAQRLTEIS